MLRDELAEFSHEVLCTTEDGSLGEKGFVTQPLKRILEGEHGDRPDAVYAVGPVPMMKAVAELTRKYGVHTVVSLNPIMVDGTGMCGGCRVTVGGETKFACVDGPEFDGHLVDFDELAGRQSAYLELDTHGCRIVPKIKEAELGHKVLSAKERLAIARVKMPEQDPERRSANFDEVNLGLTPELAILEAQRCLQCKNRPCVDGCPVERAHPRLPRLRGPGRLRRRGAHPARRQRPAGHHRARLPAGDAVRGRLHPRQEGRARGRSAGSSASSPTGRPRTWSSRCPTSSRRARRWPSSAPGPAG